MPTIKRFGGHGWRTRNFINHIGMLYLLTAIFKTLDFLLVRLCGLLLCRGEYNSPLSFQTS